MIWLFRLPFGLSLGHFSFAEARKRVFRLHCVTQNGNLYGNMDDKSQPFLNRKQININQIIRQSQMAR